MTDTSKIKTKAETALATARDSAGDALDIARERAQRAGKAIEANPLAVVAGGIAIGVAVGALLPKTRRENELLGPVGRRVTDVASGAAGAARAAATAELAALPLSKSAVREQIGKFVDQVSKALSSAGEAALSHADEIKAAPAATAKPAKRSPKKAK